MPEILLMCLVATIAVACAHETIIKDLSGTSDEHQELVIGQNRTTNRKGRKRARRLSVRNEDCILYEYSAEGPETVYDESIDPKNEVDDGDVWYCEFGKEYAESIGLEDPLFLLDGWEPSEDDFNSDDGNDDQNLSGQFDDEGNVVKNYVTSGTTTLKMDAAVIDLDANTLLVDPESVEISNGDNVSSGRKLQWTQIEPKVGTRKVIVVRILTYDSSAEPGVSTKQVKDSIYEKDFSFKKIYENCSYNKLKMEPFTGTTSTGFFVEDGIVDVYLNEQQSDFVNKKIASGKMKKSARDKITRYARIRAKLALGELSEQFDFVMFAMPDGLLGTLAFAALNRYDSYYFEDWLARPSFPLHEIGHNLGMNHAGEFGVYDDKVGYMGYSYKNLDGPVMCFNPANSFYLGWYKDQTNSYNAYNSGSGKEFTLNGICDYDPSKAGSGDDRKLVILQLTQLGKDKDFYIGYNRQKGINSGTFEDANHVLILKKFGPPESSLETQKLATLAEVGQYYEIKKYNNDKNKRSVYISWVKKKNNGKDAVIRISTQEPTLIPTKNPTRAPTLQPTPKGGLKDRDDLKYKGEKDCTWVAQKPQDRCKKTSKGELIQTYWCPKTCEDVSYCEDRKDLKFSNNKDKDCSWVEENTEKRCGKKWKGETIESYWCPLTCDSFCEPPSAKSMTMGVPKNNIFLL